MRRTTVVLMSILGVLVVVVALGFGVYLTQKKFNDDQATKRQAATLINHITVAYPSESQGFYPEAPNEVVTVNYANHYYEGLTAFDKNMEIRPLLAESWENPSENTWRFRLRKDVTFHNGQKMTPEDVVASFNMAMANENVSPLIPTIASVEKVDNNTIDIKTNTPTPILANTITAVFILPKSLIDAKDWSHPIGTGPYKFVSADGSTLNVTRYDNYYGQKANVKNVTLEAITDNDERLAALKKGDIDVMEEVQPIPAGSKTKDGKQIKLAVSDPIGVNFLDLDSVRDTSPYVKGTTTNPLKDVRVREAMSLALDRTALINCGDYNTSDKVATQLVPSTIFGYDSDIKPVKQDVVGAKALMKEAGFEKGFTITLDITNGQKLYPEMLKKQLAEIGITLVVNPVTPDQAGYDKILSGDTSMFTLSWLVASGDALEAYENIYATDSSLNIFKVNDTQMNDLIAKTKTASDLSKRKEYLKELAVIGDQKKYVIPVLSEVTIYAYRDGLVITPRADGMNLAFETSGAVPSSLGDYSFLGTIKRVFSFLN